MKEIKILVVDDEIEILELVAKKLREKNYTVITASEGRKAIEICKTNRPDLLLLDIAIPDMDGYEVVSNLNKEKATQDIPTIFLTGKELTTEGLLNRVAELGAYDFLMKPFAFDELLEKIKKAIR